MEGEGEGEGGREKREKERKRNGACVVYIATEINRYLYIV